MPQYTSDQIDQYLAHVKETSGAKYTPEQFDQFAQHIRSQYQAPEESLGEKALDLGKGALEKLAQGLDYAGGNVRTGLARLVGVADSADTDAALSGHAPTSAEFLKKAGVGELGSLSDLTGGFIAPDSSFNVTGRGATGLVLDMLTDPLTLASGPLGKLASKAGKFSEASKLGKAAIAADAVVNAPANVLANRGKNMYRKGLKLVDLAAEKMGKGKHAVSDYLLDLGITGTNRQIADQATEQAGKLSNRQKEILSEADQLGATVDLPAAVGGAQSHLDALASSRAPVDQELAGRMQEFVDKHKIVPAPAEPDRIVMEKVASGKYGFDAGGNLVPLYDDVPRTIKGKPEVKPVTASEASRIKTTLSKLVSADPAFNILKDTPEGQQVILNMAGGLRTGVENAVGGVKKGLGTELRQTNENLGKLLTTRQALWNEGVKGTNKNFLTSIDAMLLGYGNPWILAAKKAGDLSKTTWLRTKVGKALHRAGTKYGRTSSALGRQAFIDLMDTRKKDEQ